MATCCQLRSTTLDAQCDEMATVYGRTFAQTLLFRFVGRMQHNRKPTTNPRQSKVMEYQPNLIMLATVDVRPTTLASLSHRASISVYHTHFHFSCCMFACMFFFYLNGEQRCIMYILCARGSASRGSISEDLATVYLEM